MISKYRMNYQELQKNTLDFSKVKLFRQRDDTDVTKKKKR